MSDTPFSYVGSLPCGCGCAIVFDDPAYVKDTAKEVQGMIARGLHVQRWAGVEAQTAFMAHCERYPHEDWQHRMEAAKAARAARGAVPHA